MHHLEVFKTYRTHVMFEKFGLTILSVLDNKLHRHFEKHILGRFVYFMFNFDYSYGINVCSLSLFYAFCSLFRLCLDIFYTNVNKLFTINLFQYSKDVFSKHTIFFFIHPS